ncbi:DUF1616 domain-containing protein [Haladaptatus sp. GCM10025707]|uniref:DUF1616 domain-containing protein n=1 Tax=unclassified Haladaptatus TaxID=2622732 RepID=UPI0023E7B617|nr:MULTISPECIES: DUF1616 domain-containing protein [unclassified Haladaptatus]
MSETRTPFPFDLLLVVGLTLLADAAILVVGVTGTLRILVGLPLILVLPGYAMVAALYPGRVPEEGSQEFDNPSKGLRKLPGNYGMSPIERIGLSVVASVALVPFVVFVLNFAWTIAATPILLGVSVLTLLLAFIALAHRLMLPAERQYRPSLGMRADAPSHTGSHRDSRSKLPTILLAVSLILVAASAGYAATVPPQSEEFSALYYASVPTGQSEEAPGPFAAGQAAEVPIGINNEEGEEVTYTVVGELQRVEQADNGELQVVEEEELVRQEITVGDGQNATQNLTVEPSLTGGNLRMAFYLYKGDVPQNPSEDNAYRSIHRWVTVNGGGADLEPPASPGSQQLSAQPSYARPS